MLAADAFGKSEREESLSISLGNSSGLDEVGKGLLMMGVVFLTPQELKIGIFVDKIFSGD